MRGTNLTRNAVRRRHACGFFLIAIASASFGVAPAKGQTTDGLLTTRAELLVAAQNAEKAGGVRNQELASSIRHRLQNGDFQIGDRIVLTYLSDVTHTDTLVVRTGPTVALPAVQGSLSLDGVLRSELAGRLEIEVLKYIKATEIEVTPLTRVGVLGEVAHPGYFALRSDVPLADAIMMAGGPTGTADVERTLIRRGNGEFRSADETSKAISRGLTLDQFGLSAGDELVVGRRREFMSGAVMPFVGAVASLTAIFVALHHH